MSIDLARFEREAPFAGDIASALAGAQRRLGDFQNAQIVHRRRLIVALDGWDGSNRRDVLKLLAAGLDPTFATAHAVPARRGDDEAHWLAPYWSRLPGQCGQSSLFLRSWAERAVADKVSNRLNAKQWSRAADEINEFENAQTEQGTIIVKLFLHVDAEVQAARLKARADDPWQRWRIGADDLHSLEGRDSWQSAWTQLLRETDTRWASWQVIDANDPATAALASLGVLNETLGRVLPAGLPAVADHNVVVLNRSA